MGSPLKTVATMTVNTKREMHSCIILSCMREKGPPVICEPMRLAGIMKLYSNSAIPHESRMMAMRGQSLIRFICWSLRLPYQANVMKTFEQMSMSMVRSPRDML